MLLEAVLCSAYVLLFRKYTCEIWRVMPKFIEPNCMRNGTLEAYAKTDITAYVFLLAVDYHILSLYSHRREDNKYLLKYADQHSNKSHFFEYKRHILHSANH
jgi:hypothetical protein